MHNDSYFSIMILTGPECVFSIRALGIKHVDAGENTVRDRYLGGAVGTQ